MSLHQEVLAAVETVSLATLTLETLLVRYWLKHFLPANSIESPSADNLSIILLADVKCFIQ